MCQSRAQSVHLVCRRPTVAGVDLIETLRSTGAAREFRADPVPDDVLARVLDTARFAPSGGNRQAWRVIVLRDAAARRQLRDLYTASWYEYLAQGAAGLGGLGPLPRRGSA